MRRRLVFKERDYPGVVSKRDKRDVEAMFGAICVNQFWLLTAQRRTDMGETCPLFELDYQSRSEDIKLTYSEDPITECKFVTVSGADRDKACALIQKQMDTWTADEMIEAWKAAPHDSARISAVLRLGVGAPCEYDARFAQLLREALTDQDRAVRDAAVVAAAYTRWPELDGDIEAMAAHDSDETCRERARILLEGAREERSRLRAVAAPCQAGERPSPPASPLPGLADALARVDAHLSAAAGMVSEASLRASGLADELRRCRDLEYNHLTMSTLQDVGRWLEARGEDDRLPADFWQHLAEAAKAMSFDQFVPYFRGKAARQPKQTWDDVEKGLRALASNLPTALRTKHKAAAEMLEAYARRPRRARATGAGVDPTFAKMFDGLFEIICDPELPPELADAAWPIIDCNTFSVGLRDGLMPRTFADVWWRQSAPGPAKAGSRRLAKPGRARSPAKAGGSRRKSLAKPAVRKTHRARGRPVKRGRR